MSDRNRLALLLALAGLLLLFGNGKGCSFPNIASRPKATAVTYVHEKDATAVPSPVQVALNKLNRDRNIVATLFEADTVDGAGEVPEQYKVPLLAAKEAGLPALVVTANEKVLRVVKDPKTEDDVLKAVP